jgi:16S rRNA A1518/A1519 N6-dimethyltransferase RsmA/KsgA/DIM1 with predicted DNA glycosylase/AP lyase activity
VSPDEEAAFQATVQRIFGMRRKQIRRVVRALASLDAAAAEAVVARVGIDPEARPETLAPSALVALTRALRP